jgi:Fic family protein
LALGGPWAGRNKRKAMEKQTLKKIQDLTDQIEILASKRREYIEMLKKEKAPVYEAEAFPKKDKRCCQMEDLCLISREMSSKKTNF